MFSFWLRNLTLWCCRLIGTVYRFCRRPVVLHLMILTAIAGALWLADKSIDKWWPPSRETPKQEDTAPSASTNQASPADSNGVTPNVKEQAGEKPSQAPAATGGNRAPGQPADRQASQQGPPTAQRESAPSAGAARGVQPPAPGQPAPTQADATAKKTNETDRTSKKAATANSSKTRTPPQESRAGGQEEEKDWLTLWNVLSLWAFGLVAWWVVQARRRLVIGRFEDRLDKQAGIDAPGFGLLVATELTRLGDLFSEFEEGRSIQSIPEKLEPINAAFQTEGVGGFLQNTVSAETKFSVGPVQIPVGDILSLVGQLVQGPRLSGQLYRDGEQQITTVRLEGSRGDRTWNIIDKAHVEAGKMTWRPMIDVAQDVACRLFAELALGRSVTWEALSRFVAGVRAYRQRWQVPKQRKLNLKEAERALLQAQVEDPDFDLAYYNLGVVYYTELEKLEAAGKAFARAIEKNNQRWSTYYALALVQNRLAQSAFRRQETEAAKLHLSQALDLCDQALHLAPPAAEAATILSLKAILLWWCAFRIWAGQPTMQQSEFRRSGAMSRRALRKAWQALCWTELGFGMSARRRPSALDRARQLASRRLQDWAEILLEVARLQASRPPEPAAARLARRVEETRTRLRSLGQQRGFLAALGRAAMRCEIRTGEMSLASTPSNLIRRIALRKATYVLRQASRLTPAETSVYVDLGKTYIERRRYEEAVDSLGTATRQAPTSSDPRGFLALAYACLDRRGQATLASGHLFASVSGASQESLQALEKATDTLRELYAQIQEFATTISQNQQTPQTRSFRRWSRRRRRRFCYRLAGHERRGRKAAKAEFDALVAQPDTLVGILAAFEKTRQRITALRLWSGIKTLSERGHESMTLLETLLHAPQDQSQESAAPARQLITVLSGTREEGMALLEVLGKATVNQLDRSQGPFAALAQALRDKSDPGVILIEKLVRAWHGPSEQRIAALQTLFEEKKSLGHDWEVGEIGERLTGLYRSVGQLPAAEKCLRETIDHLEKSIHQEIPRRGLHAALARILRQQKDYTAALKEALLGVARDPVAPYERIELGWAYCDLAEFSSAQSVWEDALLLDPENPHLHVNLGLVHLQRVGEARDKAERLAQRGAALQHLTTALELFEDTDLARNHARFLLSLVYTSAGRHADAVRELRALDRRAYCDLAVAIHLADACLSNRSCADAEQRFRQVAAEVDKHIKTAKDGPHATVDVPPGAGNMLLCTASAYARLGIANALAEREIFLDQAIAEVRKARAALLDLREPELKQNWEGRCTFFAGVILTKLGRLDQAIPTLERALANNADAETYVALADALERKAESIADSVQKTGLVRRALFYYQEARRLDCTGELEERITKATARLQPAATK